ncbi:TBC1 domain family member 1 [Ixodes scapularis]
MLDSTVLRKRFYKKLNIMDSEPGRALQRHFRVQYLGCQALDRRYTQPMLPWIVADLRRSGLKAPIPVLLEVRHSSLRAHREQAEAPLFEHPLHTISRFSQTSADRCCFAYLQRDPSPEVPPQCHVFQAADKETVVELFVTVREVSKESSSHGGLVRVGSSPGLDAFLSNAHQFEVLYVGRLKGSCKQSSHTFLDDAVDRFKTRELERLRQQRQPPDNSPGSAAGARSPEAVRSSHENMSSPSSEMSSLENISEVADPPESGVQPSPSGDPREALLESLRSCAQEDLNANRALLVPPHTLITHTHSLDTQSRQILAQDLHTAGRAQRVRSVSGDVPCRQTSLPALRPRVSSGGAADLRRADNGGRHSRTMLLLVLRRELCLLSTDRKQLLVNKPFCDISRCYLGTKHPDHFGFNCRDSSLASTDNYIAHIFKCSSVEVANEIMQTLKQAFHSALQTKEPCPPQLQGLCDSCPMQRFHKLCLDLEGLSSDDCCSAIQRYIQQLSDSDKQSIAAKYQVGDLRSVQEKNELYMSLLRGLYEGKQARHTHHSSLGHRHEGFLDLRAPSFTFDHLKEKAKKSLSNSFDTILKRKAREGEPRERSSTLPSEEAFKLTLSETSPTGPGSQLSSREGSADPGSRRDVETRSCGSALLEEEAPQTPKRSPLVNIFLKVGRHQSTEESPLEPGSSWRQAIFQRVHSSPNQVSEASPAAGGTRKTREELRGLWRKAIMEQILLIRMEKENRQLQVSQDEATSKRLRLAYEEVCPCPREACDQWDQLLAMGPGQRINPDLLADLVRAGLPRHRRGEIWLLLAEQCKLRRPPCQGAEVDLSVGYQQLLNQLTSYQHAILIDLGRTFPSHPFFRECLGPGQLSLFNLLKAYSLLDPQVGYCQGLSFVAGVLLLHMTEEEAFEMMKHFLFHLGFRKQYKPDMLALQDEATSKRLRLAYEEVCPCPREACDQWDQLLAMGPGQRINPDLLADLVRAGLPRHRRGEIWLLLAEQCKLRRPPCQGAEVDLSVGYQQLLNQLTSYQHAILIDLGRTFPSHPFFRECLGPGQLSLFNLLKAYSLLDPQVGYCQGLSFVAGVLLLHMTEEEAFEMMKHFLFHLGFRKQYKPDMLALQVELYQLYRLLHDHQRELYVHLEKYDVGPALFAAPWFLTLFASQFPLGFVSRLFDVIFLQGAEAVFKVALSLLGVFSAQLMACSSFEAIMDCFKSGLPSLSLHQMEALFAQVLSLDLGRELCAYEVEYQLIQEQAICRAPGEDQRNMHLLEQLQVSQSSVGRLEAQVASYQGTVRHLEDRIRKLEDERDALLHSNGALRHRLERLERGDADRAPERSLSFGAAGRVHDDIAGLVQRLAEDPDSEEDSLRGQRHFGCDGL